ncbi:unnamed protein product, partial [Iphiclides podalirius]
MNPKKKRERSDRRWYKKGEGRGRNLFGAPEGFGAAHGMTEAEVTVGGPDRPRHPPPARHALAPTNDAAPLISRSFRDVTAVISTGQ